MVIQYQWIDLAHRQPLINHIGLETNIDILIDLEIYVSVSVAERRVAKSHGHIVATWWHEREVQK